MPAFHKIAFVLDDWNVPSPGQQLLDRFLIGYPHEGKFKTVTGPKGPASAPGGDRVEVAAFVRAENKDALKVRREKHGLVIGALEPTLSNADAVVVVPGASGVIANDELVTDVLEKAALNSRCFVFGALSTSLTVARQQLERARQRTISVIAGTPVSVTWRLPDAELPRETRITDAVIIVPERSPAAELNGWEGLFPIIERRRRGEAGVRSLECFQGVDVWRALDRDRRLWPLVAAAISRSSSPLGDSVLDGRTQDLVGLGLLPKLAPDAMTWMVEHRDGVRSTVLSLPGAIGDINVAVRRSDGSIYSAQLYRPAGPAEHSFSRLAAVLENFFRTGKPSWPVERNLLIAGLLSACRNAKGKRLTIPKSEGDIHYTS